MLAAFTTKTIKARKVRFSVRVWYITPHSLKLFLNTQGVANFHSHPQFFCFK